MLIVTRKQLLGNNSKLLPITSHVLFEESSGKFFKFTDFEPSACFIGETLSQPRLLTLTPYDPVFLAIEKVWPLQEETFNEIDNLLEEKDMHLFPYLKDSLEKICEKTEIRGSSYYKPSPAKIVQIIKSKYERLLKVCSDNGVSLRKPGLQTNDPITIASPIVINILKRDIQEFFIKKLQEQLQVQPPKVEPVPFAFSRDNNRHEQSPKKNLRKSQPQPTKADMKREKQIKHTQSTNHTLNAYLKKKEPEPSQP